MRLVNEQKIDAHLLEGEHTRFNFSDWITKIATAAATKARKDGDEATATLLEQAEFQWLRHTAVTRMAEAGCTVLEIAEVTGHSNRSVAEIINHYLVQTGKMAEAAFRKRLTGDGLGDLADRLLDGDGR